MLGRDHALLGVAGSLALAPLAGHLVGAHMGPVQIAAAGVVGAGFSLLPDIDEPGSSVSRKFGLASEATSHIVRAAAGGHRQATHSIGFACLVTGALWAADKMVWTAPVTILLCLAVAGRFVLPLHLGKGFLGALVLPVAAGWATWRSETGKWLLGGHVGAPHLWAWLPVMAGAGVLLHMAGDILTKHGVPLLWPLRWRFAIPVLGHTSSARETLLGTCLGLATAVLVWLEIASPMVHAGHI